MNTSQNLGESEKPFLLRKYKTVLEFLVSGVFGFAALYTAYFPISANFQSLWIKTGLLGLVFIVFAGLTQLCLHRFASRRYRDVGVNARGQGLIFAGLLLAGILLAWAYPLYPLVPGKLTIEITATGEKNAKSTNNEVHIDGLYFPNGRKEDFSRFTRYGKDRWEIRESQLIGSGNRPARTSWQSNWVFPVMLMFHITDYSGIVKVALNGSEQTIDLYSKNAAMLAVDLTPDYPAATVVTYRLASGLVIGLILNFLAIVLIQNRSWSTEKLTFKGTLFKVAAFAAPMIAVWALFWLALWPGLQSLDTVDQLNQIHTGVYNDAHPVVLTWTWGLVLQVWNDPAAISLFQILSLSLVAAYGLTRMRRLGTPTIWLVIAAVLFALSIVNSFMVVTIWKDVLFSVAFLLFFVFWVEIVTTGGDWLKRPINFIGLVIIAALVCLYRHNGLPAILFSLGCLILFVPKIRLRAFFSLAAVVALYVFVKGPIYDLVKVPEGNPFFETVFELYSIGAHIKAGTEFNEADLKILNQIRPVDDGWGYSCDTARYILRSEKMHIRTAYNHQSELRGIFLRSALASPLVTINHRLCTSAIVWQISNSSLFYTIPLNPDKAENSTKNQALLNWVIDLFVKSRDSGLFIYLWRPAAYLYLFLFGVIVTAIKNGKRYLLLAIPVLGICLTLMLHNHSQSLRYMYAVYVVALLYWPYLYTARRAAKTPATIPFNT